MEKQVINFCNTSYTDLLNFKILKSVHDFVAPKDQNTKLSSFPLIPDSIIYIFVVSSSTVSRILLKWLAALQGNNAELL